MSLRRKERSVNGGYGTGKESKEWKLLAEHSGQLVSANVEETGGGSREESHGENSDA